MRFAKVNYVSEDRLLSYIVLRILLLTPSESLNCPLVCECVSSHNRSLTVAKAITGEMEEQLICDYPTDDF